MIDWDMKSIEEIDKHYKKILKPNINFIYFCRHFEEMYRMSSADGVLLPDILNDITFYTFNGVNARYKLLFGADEDKEITERLLAKRMKQRAKRQEARNNGLDEYYKFIIQEIEEFIEKYPFWKELLK